MRPRRCPFCGHDHDQWICDLFSGAGGAAMGYHRAGFGVVGVDIEPQPRYPFEFVQADAMTYPLDGFDAIHASPPCHDHIRTRPSRTLHDTGWLLNATRERLTASGTPWVIENVPGAPMRVDYKLCGCMFNLGVRRERWFETSWRGFELRSPCQHRNPALTLYGHNVSWSHLRNQAGMYAGVDAAAKAMGIDWMTLAELVQAIPPAYTEYVGLQLRRLLAELAVAP